MLLRILSFILLSLPAYSQSFQLSVGSNLTNYLFANSAATNPPNMRAASGMHLSLYREAVGDGRLGHGRIIQPAGRGMPFKTVGFGVE